MEAKVGINQGNHTQRLLNFQLPHPGLPVTSILTTGLCSRDAGQIMTIYGIAGTCSWDRVRMYSFKRGLSRILTEETKRRS
jgi:hypothetical protein